MAAPKFTNEQRAVVLEWIAADYSIDLIQHWIAERRETEYKAIGDDDQETIVRNPDNWPEVSRQTIYHYRKRYAEQIATLRAERHTAALDSGLALKAERIARLAEHADRLEAIKWIPDKNGRLWNEKAWRETLDDIAREMGHRRQGIDITLERELEAFLDRLRDNLDADTYARILALAAGSAADS